MDILQVLIYINNSYIVIIDKGNGAAVNQVLNQSL